MGKMAFLLFGQQMQLTTKQIGTKLSTVTFLDYEFIIVLVFSHLWSNNPGK